MRNSQLNVATCSYGSLAAVRGLGPVNEPLFAKELAIGDLVDLLDVDEDSCDALLDDVELVGYVTLLDDHLAVLEPDTPTPCRHNTTSPRYTTRQKRLEMAGSGELGGGGWGWSARESEFVGVRAYDSS
jgi:hypothetical protein